MQPSSDERKLAALAHASIIANIFNLAGLFAALLIWALERERSAFVRAHAMQALLYQGMVLLFSIVLVAMWGVCLVVSLLPAALRPDLYRNSPPNSFWIALLGLIIPLGFGLLAMLYALYGAYQVYRGQPFRYPLAGRIVNDAVGKSPVKPATAPAPVAAPAPTPDPVPSTTLATEARPIPAPDAEPQTPPPPPSNDDQPPTQPSTDAEPTADAPTADTT